ncbi:DeoR/GlpR family DNA-binding transcription regulator [Glutamicibacter sp. MNS18]|uniref:DeoR/GlpR family DNA-binding transcription regulator n=1 Tax=Glutamicibacter sp. MNS18 TaxID=2989817 RepID=UPI002235A4E2|nr:DeoR/GlpR family DNA-binding transcription regulator [Glutamicibacter sp. MNS18]MCW4466053.1 DeoR/GlpR family DNA-binding transcription regulator [Glutamicibacter sp. MNS18]
MRNDESTQGHSEIAVHGLPPEHRRDEVTSYVNKVRNVRVEDLAEHFGVSAMTIHRDLDTLAADGRLERVRGGARAITARLAERDVRLRRHLNAEVKEQLAATAAQLIPAGAVIALDDSTTVGALGAHLSACAPSTVITHSLDLMNQAVAQQIPMVGLGGQYYAETDSFLGSVVVEQARRLTCDVVFVSTTAIKNGVLLHPDAEAAQTKAALLKMGGRKVLLADGSKFEGAGLYHVMALQEFDDIVIDDQVDTAHREQLRALGLDVHVAANPVGSQS